MYHLPPPVKVDDVASLPKCMYQLRNMIYLDNDSKQFGNQPSDTLKALEKRQDVLIERLEELRCLLLKHEALVSLKPLAQPAVLTTLQLQQINKVTCSLSLAVTSPTHPPTSLLVLLPWLQQNGVTSSLTCHLHSSLPANQLADVFHRETQDPAISISLIWKEVGSEPILIVNPIVQSGILGEVNVVRYIMRLISPEYGLGDAVLATAADQLLDLSHQLLKAPAQDQKALLQVLNPNPWLLGATLTFTDILLWNAVHRSKLDKSLPGHLRKWFNACSQQSAFTAANKYFQSK